MMRPPRKFTADAAAGLLLVGSAAVLLATPYDGGSCTNVLAAYATPAASLSEVDRPRKPQALAQAQGAADDARAAVAEMESERAQVEELQAAAEAARRAAADAQSDLWEMPFSSYSSYSSGTYSAQLDVDIAESAVDSAEYWLEHVKDQAADTSGYSFYTQEDVAEAQADLDEAQAELSEAESALADAEADEAASESEAENAEASAEQLDATADAAEQAAADAATSLADRERSAEQRLYSAQDRVDRLEAQHDRAMAEWSHEQRVAADEVTASNNVRESCRQNGAWRAGVAMLDVALAAGLVLRRWRPRLPRFRR